MPIEQRQSIRRKKPIEADLRLDGNVLASRVRDIGMGGAFVELEGGALAPAVPVEVRLRLSERGAPREYSLPAEVVHVGHDGVALKFRQYDNWAYTALVNFLYAAH